MNVAAEDALMSPGGLREQDTHCMIFWSVLWRAHLRRRDDALVKL